MSAIYEQLRCRYRAKYIVFTNPTVFWTKFQLRRGLLLYVSTIRVARCWYYKFMRNENVNV